MQKINLIMKNEKLKLITFLIAVHDFVKGKAFSRVMYQDGVINLVPKTKSE